MAAAGGGGGLRSLEETSTWAVAVVCFVLVAISIFIEQVLHHLGKFLMNRQKRALYKALEKVKSELMLLGFISLLLTVGQNLIAEICVTTSVGNSWAPCSKTKSSADSYDDDENRRKLLQVIDGGRRFLAGGGGGVDKCADKGKVPLISTDGVNQLHVFIFVLAVFHVVHSITTLLLGKLKMKKWKTWEKEIETIEYQFSHDPERFRFARDTTFGRRHLNYWSKSSILIWIVCFFRQFATTIAKTDYLTLRHGFIMAHLSPRSSMNFNFLKYIQRSLEEDFQFVVGISPVLWFFAVLFLLFNTNGWYSHYWLPFLPLIIILMVSVKLQVIITRMALRIMEHDVVVKGVPIVQPADNLFWCNRPKLLLNLIHFVLFQNAFQVAFFVWSWYEFGINSCFHEEMEIIIIIITMGVIVQIVCSYITLPLYALVTQMGSNMKPVIFNDRVATALRSWHHTARKHVKQTQKSGRINSTSTSPVHLLRSDNYYSYEIERWEDGEGSQNQSYSTEGSSSHHHSSNQGKSGMVDDMEIQAMDIMEEKPKTTYSTSFSFENTHKLTSIQHK